MNTKTLAIVAVVAIAAVALAGVAIAMGGDGGSNDRVEYNYDFSTEDYELYGEKIRTLSMDLAIKNVNHVSIDAEGGLRLDYITVTVKYDGQELFKDRFMNGVMSPGNDYVAEISWRVPLDFTLDQIDGVEIGWSVPEGVEEIVGADIGTPNFVHNESLSTDKYA